MAEPIELRPGRPDDVPVVADIWRTGWADGHLGNVPDELLAVRTAESFDVRAAERLADTVVAVVGGRLAGFVMVVADEVEQMYVAREQRGSGIAAVLLAEAESIVAAHGHKRAWLAVVAGNVRARTFYERNGWYDEGPFDYRAASAEGPVTVPCRRYVRKLPL
ncbi:hypothetical protein SRB5_05480 [Streptomyces sp. RB5]|uniref:N-acetyltransferase domain-containing protein n=1 Tax=Streptomyces smaragdinus TaxID=2585196 RepID=A0A7K0CAG0_9ACTN|nr:GNAT family N-acetyltransferase [Streptomyces smaragdinus]MQY10440.1 hypothetical protein [Streptomyces smaragdinus]